MGVDRLTPSEGVTISLSSYEVARHPLHWDVDESGVRPISTEHGLVLINLALGELRDFDLKST
jgi:hypothetical protein